MLKKISADIEFKYLKKCVKQMLRFCDDPLGTCLTILYLEES